MSALATLGMTSTAAQAAAMTGALPASREKRLPRVGRMGFTCVLPLQLGADRRGAAEDRLATVDPHRRSWGPPMATMLARSCRGVNTFDTLAK
ncbi:hypothetical protein Kpho01_01650 [Kitasatospora phosalacinea]|uniref:Secreted protein n=1 Tax=Kitasatospora phosalacinea TaxID=2065 RepID=A0A9W6UL51_9ACTN|nr:hypothetical protein Kpho01_01650 [Kitasatospora phosalacinea]